MEESASDIRWIFINLICFVGILINGVIVLGVLFLITMIFLLNSLF